MIEIKNGDFVRNKKRNLNGGIPMTVTEVIGQLAKCNFTVGFDIPDKEEWFSFDELELAKYG